MKRTAPILAILLIIAALAAACGGDSGETSSPEPAAPAGEPAAGGPTLEVSATEFAFDPSELTAPADTDVTLNLTNAGNVEHDWAIKEQPTKVVAMPGQTGSGTFSLPAGEYVFYCSVPGHEAAGMIGTLTVE